MAIGTGKNFDLITNLMNQRKSGTVVFTLPLPDGSGNAEPVVGCLIGDLSIKLANKWQAILPNIDAVTLASQIIESSGNAIAWLKTTQSAWMGAEPLRISVPFYLFSMNSKQTFDDGTKMDDNLDKGLITIKVGNQFTLSKMLLEDLTVDPSAVQVADGNPLYVKVTATFKSSRVLYSKEITDMFVTS